MVPAKAPARVQEQLNAVGISLEDDELPISGGLAPILFPGNFSFALSQAGPFDEPDQALSPYYSIGPGLTDNFTGHGSPQLDALIDAQSREFDFEKRRGLVYEAQRSIVREHGATIPLPSGFEYSAHRAHVILQSDYDIIDPPPDILPHGCDIWLDPD
jgi:ABC-type transport system substrate-binding protein